MLQILIKIYVIKLILVWIDTPCILTRGCVHALQRNTNVKHFQGEHSPKKPDQFQQSRKRNLWTLLSETNVSGVFIISVTVGSTDGSERWKAMNKMHINIVEMPKVKE